MPGLTDILKDLKENTEGSEIGLEDVVEEFENRGFGPLLLAPALIVILPTGAIPGIPALCAIFIILVSGQMLFGRNHPWLPKRLKDVTFSREKFKSAVEKALPWTKKIDRFVHARLEFLTGPTGTRIVGVIAILLSLVMIPLEFVPFACAIPGASLALLALGLSAKDGAVALVGVLSATASAWAVVKWWPF